MKDRLEKIADAADALEDANRRVAKSLEDRKAIVADQARLRENLRVAPSGSDLAKVATRKLLDQEALLESIDAESKSATAAQEAARASSLAVLTDDALAVLDDVEVGRYTEYTHGYN